MINQEVIDLITQINNNGGKCYIVGGYVRDKILGINSLDIDIEVFNLELEELVIILKDYDIEVFDNFGVIKVNDLDVDLSLPKLELKNNEVIGYYKIKYDINPHLSIKEAALRRDITINSIYYDPITDTYIDEYNGISDLHDKSFKVLNPNFNQDPIRLFRSLVYIVKFDLNVDNKQLETLSSFKIDKVNNKAKALLNKLKSFDNYEEKLKEIGIYEKIRDLL